MVGLTVLLKSIYLRATAEVPNKASPVTTASLQVQIEGSVAWLHGYIRNVQTVHFQSITGSLVGTD